MSPILGMQPGNPDLRSCQLPARESLIQDHGCGAESKSGYRSIVYRAPSPSPAGHNHRGSEPDRHAEDALDAFVQMGFLCRRAPEVLENPARASFLRDHQGQPIGRHPVQDEIEPRAHSKKSESPPGFFRRSRQSSTMA